MKKLKIFVSTDCIDLSTVGCDIMFPENRKHPVKQVEFIKDLLKENVGGKAIATNSPYILQAIRYYSSMYGIEDLIVYLNKKEDGTEEDITETLNDIFTSFAKPLRGIMNVDEIRKKK